MKFFGNIEVICGTMFSGKTEELIRRLRRAQIGRQKVQAFKPSIDSRYHADKLVSHSGWDFEAHPVTTSKNILETLEPDTTVIGIDEAQFFDECIVVTVKQLARQGIRVIVAGLELDFRGEPFGFMPPMLCLAEEILKLHAVCTVCGKRASRTQRIINGKPASYDDPVILVGATEFYEPRCREHHLTLQSALDDNHESEFLRD